MSKHTFFRNLEREGRAVTFRDVRLKTGYSKILPKDVSTESKFSRNIRLKIPIVSAAMDTVTEFELAIALAKLGGLGVIHRGLSPQDQANQVAKVKYHLNGLINNPICIDESRTVEYVLNLRREKGYTFHSFLVLNPAKKLVGIITEDDVDFCDDISVKVKNIMSTDLVTGKQTTTIREAYRIMKGSKGKRVKVLPLVKDQRVTGMYVWSDVKRIVTGASVMYNIDRNGQLMVGAAIGSGDDAFERLELLVKRNVDVIVIDTAHADSEDVINTIEKLKNNIPH